MRYTKEMIERFTLTVDRDEVEWLRGYVQNALAEESELDSEMRSRYFHAIDRLLKSDNISRPVGPIMRK